MIVTIINWLKRRIDSDCGIVENKLNWESNCLDYSPFSASNWPYDLEQVVWIFWTSFSWSIIILSWSNSGRVSKMMSASCLQNTLPVACCVLLWIIYPLALICQSMKYYKCDSAWQNNETLKKAVFNDFSIESFPENVMNTYMELYCFFLFFSLFQISLISSS